MSDLTIDHLAFSFPFRDLRHLSQGFTNGDFDSHRVKFPCRPHIDSFYSTDLDDIQKRGDKIKSQMFKYYEDLVLIFANQCLGFTLGPMRGRGLHGYKDSMTIFSDNGVECGYVGIGGNRDTVFFQISGTGCKFLFDYITPKKLHFWLSEILEVDTLSRIDIAYDDFDGNFDSDYAEMAYADGAFQRKTGGPMPTAGLAHKYKLDSNGKKVYSQEMFCVGSRTSTVYWRVYNKALEQGQLQGESWFRSEAELKKWHVDALIKLDETFSNLCDFSSSIIEAFGEGTRSTRNATQKACRTMVERTQWLRMIAGKTLTDLCDSFRGDTQQVLGLLLPSSTSARLLMPDTHKQLVNHILE